MMRFNDKKLEEQLDGSRREYKESHGVSPLLGHLYH